MFPIISDYSLSWNSLNGCCIYFWDAARNHEVDWSRAVHSSTRGRQCIGVCTGQQTGLVLDTIRDLELNRFIPIEWLSDKTKAGQDPVAYFAKQPGRGRLGRG